MGSDLLVTALWTARPKDAIDWDAARAALDDTTDERLQEWDNSLEGLSLEEVSFARDDIADDLDNVRAAWERTGSEHETFEMGPLTVLITGGMSSGDSPTDLFESVSNVPEHVLEAAGFFQTQYRTEAVTGIVVRVAAPSGDYTAADLLEAVEATLHEVFPEDNGQPVVPVVTPV